MITMDFCPLTRENVQSYACIEAKCMHNINNARCQCGLDYNIIHCPHCGKRNFYALKDNITRLHPISGKMAQSTQFRCRMCNKGFDELAYQYECKAPLHIEKRREIQKKWTIDEMMSKADDALNNGAKFDDNDKRHFKRIVGYSFDEYRILKAGQQQYITKPKNTIDFNQGKVIINKLEEVSSEHKENKLNVYDEHLTQCKTCMMADNDNELCELGRNLKKAEELNWRTQ